MRQIPKEIEDFFITRLAEGERLLLFATADRALDQTFQDIVLVATTQRLFLFFGEHVKKKMFRGFVNRTKLPDLPPVERELDKYEMQTLPLADVEQLDIINLVGAGLLTVTVRGEQRTICAFTNGRMREVADFVRLLNKFKQKGELTEEDMGEEDRPQACPKCGMLYPDRDREICPRCTKRSTIFRRLLKMVFDYKYMVIAVYVLMLLSTAVGLVVPYLQGTVLFDHVLTKGNPMYGKVLEVVALIALCKVLQVALSIGNGVINVRLSAKVIYDIKTKVFSSMQRLSLSFFMSKQTGSLMTRINSDASDLQYFFVDGITYLFTNGVTIVGITIVMLLLDWQMTLLCYIPVAFLIFYMRGKFSALDRLSWRRWKRYSSLNSMISDTVKGSRVIKAFGREKSEIRRFGRVNERYFDVATDFNRRLSTIFPINSLIINFGSVIIWAFGGARVISEVIPFGTLMTFVNYIYMLYGPIQGMSNMINWWTNCMTSAQRIFEIMDAPSEVKEVENPTRVDRVQGKIELQDVSFGYEPNKYVLKNINVTVEANTMVGIVGHSGAGKSTLVNLISRLYDVNEGHILIDGVDVKKMAFEDLRRNVGIVSQEVYVFMGTVAENIAYAKPGCGREEVIRAAKIANAHDFIEKLPDGYDTMIGTGGQDLSGGERQRLSIARAILLDPRILILDEATASLDTETERQIQEALETLIVGRTTIAIAHRLSTLRNADFIVVMSEGKVVEQGPHMELLRSKGEYFRQVQKQTEALRVQGVS